MKKILLVAAMMVAGFINEANAQYIQIGVVDLSHPWGTVGYNYASIWNGIPSCHGVGVWACPPRPSSWGGDDPWRLGNIDVMLNLANNALNSQILTGTHEQTFIGPVESESLKVTWAPNAEGNFLIHLYRWTVVSN